MNRKRIQKAIKLLLGLTIIGVTTIYSYGALYNYLKGPVEMKILLGTGRVLFPPLKASVKVEGVPRPDARVFKLEKSFEGNTTNSVILWLPDSSILRGYRIIIIDTDRKKAGRGNTSRKDYALWFGYFLFQSDSGAWFIPFENEVKGPGVNPELKINNNDISFVLPTSQDVLKKIEIIGYGE